MSRSSAGFADFFPTAPSVLQQKRSKKGRQRSNGAVHPPLSELELIGGPVANAKVNNQQFSDPPATTASSSSNLSTTSSILSPSRSHHRAAGGSDSLTPLTNTDLSPPKAPSPSQKEKSIHLSQNDDQKQQAPTGSIPPTPQSEQPRIVQGSKIVYDPDLDRRSSSSSKDKKKAQYVDMDSNGGESSDPRLRISHYSHGTAGKQKTKSRPAPYVLKLWPYDAATSVGPAPPTQVVIAGFDPLTPVSHISTLFSSYGDIGEINNRTDPITGRFLGICSVKYKDAASFRHRGPLPATNAARVAYHECRKDLRIGTRRVRIELDRNSVVSERMVARAIDSINSQKTERHAPSPPRLPLPPPPPPLTSPRPLTEGDATKADSKLLDSKRNDEPPPTAPKEPASMRTAMMPQDTPRVLATVKRQSFPQLVEETPVLSQIKRDPYIFIAHCYVPVRSSIVPHLMRRLKKFRWKRIRCDKMGYYVIFENSRWGGQETERCYRMFHMRPLFEYIMNMECRPFGNPNYERSPSPERLAAERQEKAAQEKLRKEMELDVEQEKRLRAGNLDPCREALSLIVRQLQEKLLEDVKSRIGAPALYDFLDPERHVARRKELGIASPADNSGERSAFRMFQMGVNHPTINSRRPFSASNLSVLTLPRIRKTNGLDDSSGTAFRDERRKQPLRRKEVRPLYHRLQRLHDDDSDDEQRTPLAGDTDELNSGDPSRMSTGLFDSDDDEDGEAFNGILDDVPEQITRDDDYDAAAALPTVEEDVREKSPSAQKRKRGVSIGLDSRKRQKEEDSRASKPLTGPEVQDSVVAEPGVPLDVAERVEARGQDASGEEGFISQPPPSPEVSAKVKPLPLSRMEVEWSVSHDKPRPTVEDDDTVVMDLDGWQNLVKDEEDLRFLRSVLLDQPKFNSVGNLAAWAWRQKEIKALNRPGIKGPVHDVVSIDGYYVANPTGAARTEGRKRILEAEKSKYLPHRIKVQKAREEREARARDDPPAAAAEAARLAAAKTISKSTSRSTRVNNRRLIADINAQKQALPVQSGEGDVLRFNQLKKRKKPVRFARSAIHNWGLYAEENISANDMIIEYVGEKVRQQVADKRERQYLKSGIGSSYLFRIDENTVIDATKRGGIARFINHSCTPNCTARIIKVDGSKRIVIYALRDIERGKAFFPTESDD